MSTTQTEIPEGEAGVPVDPPDSTPDATPPPEGPKEAAKATEYVVLAESGDKTWKDVGRQTARSAKAAVAAHVTAAKLNAGTFVAVPARSFDPITVKTETKTKLAFS